MANAGAKLSSFPEVNDIQTGDMFPLLSGGNTNAKIDYTTLANAIIAKLKSEAGDGVLSINGKTGVVTINKSDVGLSNVDNTSDADKPVSTAVQEALDGKANNAVSEIINDHINNKNNPHAVTKAQVGLGSVANLDQSKAIKSITRSGTTFTATALDGTATTFTQQDSSTTYDIATSSTDGLMSKTDKAKLDGISSGADASPIKTVKVNGTALTPDSNKAVNVTVPTLANNATTTDSGMALDARMGKTLADQASQLAENTAQIAAAITALQTLTKMLSTTGASRANSFIYEYNLGASFTNEQSADIVAGTFDKVRPGGYWTINGHKYWAAHADYRLHCGDTELTKHHMLVFPDKSFYDYVMNSTNVTTGAYYGSNMVSDGLTQALAIVKADFGESHVLTYRNLLANAVSNGASSGWSWYDRQIDLMNQAMVYGHVAWADSGYDVGCDKSQLALFQARPDLIANRENWWLRDVRSSERFCDVTDSGIAANWIASASFGVRPAFLIA